MPEVLSHKAFDNNGVVDCSANEGSLQAGRLDRNLQPFALSDGFMPLMV